MASLLAWDVDSTELISPLKLPSSSPSTISIENSTALAVVAHFNNILTVAKHLGQCRCTWSSSHFDVGCLGLFNADEEGEMNDGKHDAEVAHQVRNKGWHRLLLWPLGQAFLIKQGLLAFSKYKVGDTGQCWIRNMSYYLFGLGCWHQASDKNVLSRNFSWIPA